ncbi:MAG: cell division protein FtsQ/DivIB [Woeseiaceae bacterium]|jgi:cell division protein FtsQ|nr:cell division protein FtsQ/DivIB [Woeseiaceae bacterium]MDG1713618.1 cell division protein FtsQ/DivIB [Woeseiaceae bacterium]MDG1865308.1 cell division protein FtsQ/DivIB [Woeseiaceae bacterium]
MSHRQAKKKKSEQKEDNIWLQITKKNFFRISVSIVLLVTGYQFFVVVLNQPIASISLEGSFQKVKSNQVEGAIRHHLDTGLLRLNISEIQNDILKIEWVDSLRIAKRWPNKLEISIFEHTPVARWGERGLLNDKGELFIEIDNQNHIPDLAHLSGPIGASKEVAEKYFILRDQLIPLGLNVKRISMSSRGAWSITLYNGIEVDFGRENIEQKINLFIDISKNVISQQSDEIESVDMRYDKGFTILWKNVPLAS